MGFFFFALLVRIFASFSVVGALAMLIVEKRDDISTLRALGADTGRVRAGFRTEGFLICGLGAVAGMTLGVAATLAQQYFGLIEIPAETFLTKSYPVEFRPGDLLAVLVACGLFLWMQKDVRLSASLSFLITAGLIVFFFPRQLGLTEGTAFTAGLVFRLRCVRDEMLTGAMLFSAVFLLNEPYTCAHHRRGRILYGAMVGAFTMGFRYFGVYETGVCFAILAVNSISGWLDRTEVRLHELIKSGRYFKEKKTGKGDAE